MIIKRDYYLELNIVYNDLLRRGYNIDAGVAEHDFKKDERYYIQSALNVDSTEKREQEAASLVFYTSE